MEKGLFVLILVRYRIVRPIFLRFLIAGKPLQVDFDTRNPYLSVLPLNLRLIRFKSAFWANGIQSAPMWERFISRKRDMVTLRLGAELSLCSIWRGELVERFASCKEGTMGVVCCE
jgi:hypothetical protein